MWANQTKSYFHKCSVNFRSDVSFETKSTAETKIPHSNFFLYDYYFLVSIYLSSSLLKSETRSNSFSVYKYTNTRSPISKYLYEDYPRTGGLHKSARQQILISHSVASTKLHRI